MSKITTHVLDAVLGSPGAGVRVTLDQRVFEQWVGVGECVTDSDGRCRGLAADSERGTYRLTFATGDYFRRLGRCSMYPEVVVIFEVSGDAAYHLPLLLSDNCYTTYRGS